MTNIDNQDINKYIKCSRCHMKFINDDEHIKNDFGYNRLNERYKQCVRCRTSSREQKAEYRADMKKQYETYGNYDPNRNNKPKNNNKPCKEKVINEKFNCELCNKSISTNTKDKHVDSSLCKRRRNLFRYLELFGSYNLMDQKHIVNGDIDFDGVIKLEQHEKVKSNDYGNAYQYQQNAF